MRYDKPRHECLDVQCKLMKCVKVMLSIIESFYLTQMVLCMHFCLLSLVFFFLSVKIVFISIQLVTLGFTHVSYKLVCFISSIAAFVELVDSSNGTTKRGADCGEVQNNKPSGMKLSRKGEKKRVSVVSPRFIQTDVSYVTESTLIFSDMVFCILNHVDLNSS